MNALRSILFNLAYVFGSLFWSVVLLWALLLPPATCTAVIARVYGGYMRFIIRHIMGLKIIYKGLENLPKDGPYIIAAKHQSALETLLLPFVKDFRYPVIVLKKELTYLPVWGLYPKRMGLVAINRGEGMESMRAMSQGCKAAVEAGRSICIFPQGTRVKPGAVKPYKAGLAKIYRDVQVPVVPMALNSGVFWGRNKFFKKAGDVTFEFLPPIPAGEPPLQMMEKLEAALEAASDKLVVAAGGDALKA